MMNREITPLSTMTLKVIAKQPTICLNQISISRALHKFPKSFTENAVQMLVDYITEAGRMTDDVPILFPDTTISMSFANSKISGAYILRAISKCPNITNLNISGCFQVSDVIIRDVLTQYPLIRRLNFRNCRKTTDASLKYLQDLGKNLISVNIGGNFNITSAGIKTFLGSNPYVSNYEELYLSGLPLNDDNILLISKNCVKLISLSISYANVTEDTLSKLLSSNGNNLQRLHIAWLNNTQNVMLATSTGNNISGKINV